MTIPYARHLIDGGDIEAVVEVLGGDWITQGPRVEAFEDALIKATGATYAISFSSGTAALHAAAAAAGLGTGDLVVTSPISFAASAACALYVGATPGFVDIDPATLNMDVSCLPECDAVIAVHYAGLPLDLGQFRRRPRVVIEDAAHALGATTPDGPVGCCADSDMCMFSFHPAKVVTSAEGGAVTTNDRRLADRLRRFRNHGIVQEPTQGGWYYEIESLGFNFRLSDVHAALGTSQLGKLDAFVTRRRALAARYRTLLADLPVQLPPEAPEGWGHAYHLFVLRVEERRRVYDELHRRGVGVQVHFVPIYRHPLYSSPGASPSRFPEAEAAYQRLLSIPMFPGLTDADQDAVVESLRAVL
jgi:UDP-4-amino-4,6-dideoxy-N-acetyl-beta-L-altrosamine transaminase